MSRSRIERLARRVMQASEQGRRTPAIRVVFAGTSEAAEAEAAAEQGEARLITLEFDDLFALRDDPDRPLRVLPGGPGSERTRQGAELPHGNDC